MLGRLICWWKGKHKRGVRHIDGTRLLQYTNPQMVMFICPRCGATHTRKVKGKV